MRFRLFCQKRMYALKGFFALAFAGTVLLFAFSISRTPLSALQGEREYYLYSASSQACIEKSATIPDLLSLRGESVFLTFPSGNEAQERARKLISDYRAEIKRTETVDGTTSYYCYAPSLGAGIKLGDTAVNLHIAIRDENVAVGSPIVFGGY